VALLPLAAEAAPGKSSGTSCQSTTVSGGVASWTYSRNGGANGFVLSTGIEVRFAPHDAGNVDAVVDVGSSVSVAGCLKTGPAGDTHLKASTITNTGTGASYTAGSAAPAQPAPPSDAPPAPPSDGPPGEKNPPAPKPPHQKPPRR